MKTKPILFSTPMVKAILDGSKTQTRRKIKFNKNIKDPNIGFTSFTPDGHFSVRGVHDNWEYGESFFKLRIDKGDILWVRETWGIGTRPHPIFGWMDGFEYKADELFLSDNIEDLPIYPNEDIDFSEYDNGKEGWKPSIFMPKAACRIFLKVTNVRVERLHDISEEDASAEGAFDMNCGIHGITDHKNGFFHLWECINGKESLESNPWVFVYDFELTDKPENFI